MLQSQFLLKPWLRQIDGSKWFIGKWSQRHCWEVGKWVKIMKETNKQKKYYQASYEIWTSGPQCHRSLSCSYCSLKKELRPRVAGIPSKQPLCVEMNVQRVRKAGHPQRLLELISQQTTTTKLLEASLKVNFRITTQSEREKFGDTLCCRSGRICLGSQRNS